MNRRLLAATWTIAILLSVAGPTMATPSLVGTTDNATGITGLVVDGQTYDVTFISDTYNNVYSASTPIFENNASLAGDAMSALTAALNLLGVTVLVGNAPGVQSAVIPYGPIGGGVFLADQSVFNAFDQSNVWEDYPSSGVSADQTYGHNDIAVFDAPEPAALALFGAGLAGLGFLRRRKTA